MSPKFHQGRKVGLFLLLAAAWLQAPSQAWAQGVLSVSIVNGYNLIVDSNVTAPSTYAPRSAYIGAQVCNTGNASLDHVFAYVGNYNGGVGSTAGIFPVTTFGADALRPHLANTGDYSLKLASAQAEGSRYIGTLAAGECRIEYWLFTYPACVNVSDGSGGFTSQEPPCDVSIAGTIKLEDDLSLNYDVWATTTTALVATASERRDFTMRNEISASANKIWPNTDSKVPAEYVAAIESALGWGTVGPDGQPLTISNTVYPGQRVITTQGIWYDLGNVGAGFDNDGDLVPDQNAWLQPVGDYTKFNADCFRMVNVYGVVVVKLVTGGELLIPFRNELYFEHLPDNTGIVGLVYYQYIATNQGCSANMSPYQEAASGFDNEKFSGDYGLNLGLLSGSFGANLSFTKTDGVSSTAPGGTLTYAGSATNTTGVHLGATDLGVPLSFNETIPAGTTFVAGSADDSPTSNLTEPTGTGSYSQGYTDTAGNLDTCTINYTITSSVYVILYSTNGGSTWTLTEPGGVTNIRWMLLTKLSLDGSHDGAACVAPNGVYDDGTVETSLPAGKSTTFQFQVTVNSNTGPVICNTAYVGFGSATSNKSAQDCDIVTGNNSLSGTVFKDDGSGGGTYGNGVKDNASEVGIAAGVIVTLYYDVNGDGKYDSGDLLYTSTTTSASGTYSFTNLPDGPFLVVVKKYDGTVAPGNSTNDAVDDATYGFTGYGNTTKDPNLPLTSDQGILKLNEDLTTATLAVNIDLDKNNATGQSITLVDFGFAPPLLVTKTVPNSLVDEGDVFSYTIGLTNRLPSVGVQGPAGCQYTVWAPSGTNGSPASKEFTNYLNALDGPNRTVASVSVEGGGLRFMRGSGFTLATQKGNITKVESLFMGYFSTNLTDDFLTLKTILGGSDDTGTISTALLDSYVGEPADLDPNSAISRNITSLRPGGGSWTYTDFSTVQFEINPSKATSADQKTFFLDAIGLRVSTDADCEASASTTLSPVPLQDRFDTGSFTFVTASPAPTSISGGTINWADVGPILPGTTKTVTVTVRAVDVTGLRTGTCATLPPPANSACNYAEGGYSGFDVYYLDGRRANNASASVPVNIQGKAELRGTVWKDTDDDGWPIEAEPALPNVTVTLYACVKTDGTLETSTSTSKDCAAMSSGNTWQRLSTAATDSAGGYEFIGLDTGYYIIEVGDTDALPTGGNSSPFSGAQSAEPNDVQDSTSGSANGHDCPGHGAGGAACNNIWGSSTANLRSDQTTINKLDAATEETVNGINFGYQITLAFLYGNVWHDNDGDATRDSNDGDLSGFTVTLSGAGSGTTTTDANGNYSFSGLAAGSYTITITPPTLLNNVWTETHETTGGTTNLNNQIPVTLAAGEISGSHDFGYTLASTSDIGDTVYYDFDADGVQDANEIGISGVTVRLYKDVDRDGFIDDGVDDLLATDVTDASGKYLFTNLAAGSYVVKVDTTTLPSNVTATGDPDVNAATIGDLIYLDANADGTKQSTEDGIPGVVVRLYEDSNRSSTLDPGEPIAASTITDVNGNYLFSGLNAGMYFVSIDTTTLPSSALVLTTANPGATVITLASNSSTTSFLAADAGYSPSTDFAIGNRVWHDRDGDNVQDGGEVGLSGVTVTVTRTAAGPCFSPACTVTTDEAGFWIVTGLTNGSYTVAASGLPRDFLVTATLPTQTIASADIMSADLGYRYKHGGTAAELAATPTGTISGRIWLDADGDLAFDTGEEMSGTTVNLLDSENNIVGTTSTAADGTYSFTGVFVGEYAVKSVDELGTRYSVVFLEAGTLVAPLDVIYRSGIETTPDSQSSVSVDGVYDDLMQDFGYRRFFGSIGDTVYLDANENATQDVGEPGFSGVTVRLYRWADAVADGGDGDGIVDSGELTLLDTKTTTADDPLTAQDESGKYLFTNVDAAPTNQFYMVEVDTTTIPGATKTLIADPDTDGVPCPTLSPPASNVCDSRDVVVAGGGAGFASGTNYLGADFGYQVTGANYGRIGDRVWIDSDGDGVKDSGEVGIPRITVFIDTDNDGVLDWSDTNANGRWDSGEGERWVETDSDGYYLFTSLPDGTYSNLRVLTSDADWPALLPTTPTFEVRSGNTASLNSHVSVVISGGAVTSIVDGDPGTTDACTGCDLSSDFGYRYTGTNILSGTVCNDETSPNGYCGATATTYSGVASGETSLAGIQVFLYMWGDDGDNVAWDAGTGVVDSGDTLTLVGSTSTGANGDYSFSNVPDNVVVVLSVSETQNLRLTTTNGNTSVEDGFVVSRQLYDGTDTYQGNTVTVIARQALNLAGDADNDIKDVDFAFDPTLLGVISKDFGDLPDSGSPDYNSTLLSSGAQHRIGSLYLGSGVSAERDGKDSSDASLDTLDDGVSLFQNKLVVGSPGAAVSVTSSAAGWIVGWFDFNGDGDLADDGERILNQAVAAGTQTIFFDVPSLTAGSNIPFFARFRLYPSQPLLLSATGAALDASFQPVQGEVEDYRFVVTVTQATITSFLARDMGGSVAIEWETASEVGTVGFFLRRWDENEGRYIQLNEKLLPSLLTPQGGLYRYVDQTASTNATYRYELVEVEASGTRNTKGPYNVNTTLTLETDAAARREPGLEPDPRPTGYAKAQRTLRRAKREDSARLDPQEHRLPASGAKIAVAQSGIHYVSLQDLSVRAGLAIDKTWLSSNRNLYSLTNRGEPVAFAASGDYRGILFYGEGLDSPYARDNVYWIGPSERNSPRMQVRKDRLTQAPRGDESFTRVLHMEQDLMPAPGIFHDPEGDYWLWDYVYSGWGPKSFSFRTDAARGSGDASVTVRLKGGTDTAANPDHHAVIRLNGHQLGDVSWDGNGAIETTLAFEPSLLNDGENSLEVEGLTDTEAPYSLIYIDSFDVRYESLYRARGNKFEGSTGANPSILISGFTRPDVMVFDITDPRLPLYIEAPVSGMPGGSYGIALSPGAPNTVYYAVAADALLGAAGIERDTASALRSTGNQGEYVVITTRALMETAKTLADYRSDLRSLVVDIEDIYDEFNFGVRSPHALKAFLAYARSSWLAPPRYVVIAGDGTWDYKDILGMGNLIPPMMVGTPQGLFASDVWFADVDPAGAAPEIAIGRLPASSAAELAQMIRKIQVREGASGSSWLNRVLMVADNADDAGNFPADSEGIAAMMPAGSQVERIYLSVHGAAARSMLIDGINEGAGTINYIGHAGYVVLADEGMLWSWDADDLVNAERPPVMTAMTCLAGNFALPWIPSIGEALVRKEAAGLAALWAPTGLSQNEFAVVLARGYYQAVSSGGDVTRIGDAIQASLRAYERTVGPSYMLAIYTLLGDPAMRLH